MKQIKRGKTYKGTKMKETRTTNEEKIRTRENRARRTKTIVHISLSHMGKALTRQQNERRVVVRIIKSNKKQQQPQNNENI